MNLKLGIVCQNFLFLLDSNNNNILFYRVTGDGLSKYCRGRLVGIFSFPILKPQFTKAPETDTNFVLALLAFLNK